MSIFDKFKKKQPNQPEEPILTAQTTPPVSLESTPSSALADKPSNMVMGVLDVFPLLNREDIVVTGRIKGTVHVGDAVYLTNCGEDNEDLFLTTILGIETGAGVKAQEATDCNVGLCIEKGAGFNVKKGTVLFSGECLAGEVRKAYINAMGDVFVARQQLGFTETDMEKLSVADYAEIWHLFLWHQSQVVKETNKDRIKENQEKLNALAEALCKKLLASKEIYCVYSKATGEPYMFSQTVKQETGYMCEPPHILLFTKSHEKMIMPSLSPDIYEVKRIVNGENGQEIYNFLGNAFYLNGVCEVAIQTHQTRIPAGMLVPKPDYSNAKPQNIPVTNPDVVRWMLLIGQIGKPEGEDAELIYRLYYRFMAIEMRKAKFLIPMQHDGELPKGDEDGKSVLKKGVQLKIATMDGKYDRAAVRMFTDWRRFRMAFGEEWSGMVETIDKMINVFDCAINATKHPQAGCYVGKDMYEDMKKL